MSNGRDWTTEEERILKEMYSEYYHLDDIAKRLDRTPIAIKSKIGRMGYTVRGYEHQRLILTNKQKESIKELYVKQKKSMKFVSEKIGVSQYWIFNYLKENGLNRSVAEGNKLRKRRVIPFDQLYKAYYQDCLSYDEMKKLWACDIKTINNSLDVHGMAKLTKKERLKIRDEFKDTGKHFGTWRDKLEAIK